jgi:integrase
LVKKGDNNTRGTIRKEENGTYTYLVYVGIGADGKKKYKRKRGFKKQKECEAALAKIIDEIERGTLVDNEKMTVKEYLNYWLKAYAKNHCRPSTYKRYKLFCRDIIVGLGLYKLQKLNPLLIQNFYEELRSGEIRREVKKQKINELQTDYDKLLKEDPQKAKNLMCKINSLKKQSVKGVSNNTIIKTHRMLHEALKHAQKWQLIYTNPCDLVTLPEADTIEIKYWNPEDIKKNLDELKGEFLYPVIYLAVHTGMREGELCALHWSDFNPLKKIITVNKTLQRENGVLKEGDPKTKKSKRIVTLFDSTVKFLNQMENLDEAGQAQGTKVINIESKRDKKNENGYIFHWEDGRPLDPHYVSEKFPKILKAHNLPVITFHDLRHTHATLLRALEVDPKVISERLGHSDVAFTLKTYTHVNTKMQRHEVDKAKKYL